MNELTIHQAHRELDRLVTKAIAEERRKLRAHLAREPFGPLHAAWLPQWRGVRTRLTARIARLLEARARLSEMAQAASFAERVAGSVRR